MYVAGHQERQPQELSTKYCPYNITNVHLLPHTKPVKLPRLSGFNLSQYISFNGSQKVS